MQSVNTLPWIPGLPFGALAFKEQDDSFGQPQRTFTSFTEFYMQSTGSNLNSGSSTDAAAIYTSTNGNWSTTTNIFTPTDGSVPAASGVSAGQFASIYIDGATVAVYIVRITSVAAGANGAITMDSGGGTNTLYGTPPVTSATARSIKIGGAWLGPNGSSTFPFGLSGGTIAALINTNGDRARVNAKNDQTYTMTTALPFATLSGSVLQGYANAPGDGGKATFTSNVTSGGNFTHSANANAAYFDLIFINTGAANANHLFDCSANAVFFRCVFHGARGAGLNNSGANGMTAIECETYDCNKSNTAGVGGFRTANSNASFNCLNCYSHDHTAGSNCDGFSSLVNNGGSLVLINCIIDTVSGNGVTFSSSVAQLISINCDYYNTGGDAIKFASTNPAGFNVIMNNNFSRIGGRVINNSVGASVGGPGSESGIIYNNGRGTDINVTDQRKSIIETSTDIFYPLGVTPWNSPDSGDFSKVLAAAIGSGRGAFTETDGTNTGTASFPDIGAAQANAITQSPAWAGGDFILPLGYVSRSYPKYQWAFTVGTSFSLVSGSLPPGLTLNTISTTTASIVGTPTALGTYAFVLRATVGTSTGDATFHITISADPDEGIGGLLGGLRPTC